jgi:hypothetical protein
MFDIKSIGGVFTDIREAITGEKIKDPNKQLELIQKLNEIEADIIESKAKIITAEAKSEHFLTSTWRPITMLVFTFIIANNYILVPYFQAMGFDIPTLEISNKMWNLLSIGIGGYVVGRSAEKIADKLKK